MENLSDYSNYVIAAYGVAILVLGGLMLVTIAKYYKNNDKKS